MSYTKLSNEELDKFNDYITNLERKIELGELNYCLVPQGFEVYYINEKNDINNFRNFYKSYIKLLSKRTIQDKLIPHKKISKELKKEIQKYIDDIQKTSKYGRKTYFDNVLELMELILSDNVSKEDFNKIYIKYFIIKEDINEVEKINVIPLSQLSNIINEIDLWEPEKELDIIFRKLMILLAKNMIDINIIINVDILRIIMSGQRCVLPVLEWSEKYKEFYSPYVVIDNKLSKLKKSVGEMFTEKLIKLNLEINEDNLNIINNIKNDETFEVNKSKEAAKEIYNLE